MKYLVDLHVNTDKPDSNGMIWPTLGVADFSKLIGQSVGGTISCIDIQQEGDAIQGVFQSDSAIPEGHFPLLTFSVCTEEEGVITACDLLSGEGTTESHSDKAAVGFRLIG